MRRSEQLRGCMTQIKLTAILPLTVIIYFVTHRVDLFQMTRWWSPLDFRNKELLFANIAHLLLLNRVCVQLMHNLNTEIIIMLMTTAESLTAFHWCEWLILELVASHTDTEGCLVRWYKTQEMWNRITIWRAGDIIIRNGGMRLWWSFTAEYHKKWTLSKKRQMTENVSASKSQLLRSGSKTGTG